MQDNQSIAMPKMHHNKDMYISHMDQKQKKTTQTQTFVDF